MRPIQIAPSILAADFAYLADQVEAARSGGADLLHVDVMDGHFVPNITLGPCVVASLRRATPLALDVHLMIERPGDFVGPFSDAGADTITFHVEVVPEPAEVIAMIRGRGKGVGISVRPTTPVRACLPHLSAIDMLLVMTVEPGFGGQSLRTEVLEKIAEAVSLRAELEADFAIQVDGGISTETIADVRRRGADVFVAGTAIFGEPDVGEAIRRLRRVAEEADAASRAIRGGES